MAFPKGKKNPRAGRTPGAQNKATLEFKDALTALLNHSAPEMTDWLKQIDDPFKRFDVLSRFAEYIHPKLNRTDVQPLGADGKPSDGFSKIIIEHVHAKNEN